ncbi:GNAT family N-acetyltransferase [Paenalkalicoccus suaedae]|uniref:GNAT family N-acetyltransferase n=1 Tax=Paenalkalicoccus suaedae TaxID=2592382 RepID=A0A859FCP4_9BACI|nr:GNAT family N-acetyltransferase [Paenalkalicoccus suaedae]QKS69986.1 GNAT family N-acetyltransferase [Paenalkalicoccus suaedae]
MSAITYSTIRTITAEQLSALFQASTITRPYEDLARLEGMLHHANLLITAWDEEKLVGVARSLTDFHYACYLSDLAVHLDYQHQGIGKALIKETQSRIGEQVALILLSAPEAMDYYPKVGFERIENGFIVKRKG